LEKIKVWSKWPIEQIAIEQIASEQIASEQIASEQIAIEQISIEQITVPSNVAFAIAPVDLDVPLSACLGYLLRDYLPNFGRLS